MSEGKRDRQNEQCMILHFNLDKWCVSKKESTDFISLQLAIYVGMVTRMEVQKNGENLGCMQLRGGGILSIAFFDRTTAVVGLKALF